MGTPVAQNLIVFGTLAIQIVTLCYLVKYVRATVGIQKAAMEQTKASQDLVKVGSEQTRVSQELLKAANEQSEGLSKPVIFASSTRSDGGFLVVNLTNVGSGPAIEIEGFVLENTGSPQENKLAFQWPVPCLEAHQNRDTRVVGATSGLPRRNVQCSYYSISGRAYVSSTQIDERNMVTDFRIQPAGASAA